MGERQGEILERVQRALAVSYLVKDDQIVGQVDWSFRVHLDLEDERAGFEAVCKQALQARFLTEIKDLEEIFAGAQAMIMSGCGADANRFPAGSMTLAERHGKTRGEEVAPIAEQSLEAVRRDLGKAYETFELPFHQLPKSETEEGKRLSFAEAATARQMLSVLEVGETLPTE